MIPISPNTLGICQWGSAMHWVAFRRADDNNLQHFVLAFDLGNEVFREILLPELPDYTSKFAGLLSVSVSTYGNSIALFQNGYFSLVKGCQTGDFYLWVVEEYGVALSWTKVLKIVEGLPRPIESSFAHKVANGTVTYGGNSKLVQSWLVISCE
nr:f-box/kelch-repeat protein [Quercus suber]